jgi:hypothetical protein
MKFFEEILAEQKPFGYLNFTSNSANRSQGNFDGYWQIINGWSRSSKHSSRAITKLIESSSHV